MLFAKIVKSMRKNHHIVYCVTNMLEGKRHAMTSIDMWAVSWDLRASNVLTLRSRIHAMTLDKSTLCGHEVGDNDSLKITRELETVNCPMCLLKLERLVSK